MAVPLYSNAVAIAKVKSSEIKVEKVTALAQIMGYGVMSTPGVIDGKVVHARGVPTRGTIEKWLE